MRKIAVVTGTRAEYGLQYWVLTRIMEDADLELQLIVTAMHLSHRYGFTVKEIETDGFPIAARVDMHLESDSPSEIAQAMSVGLAGFANTFLTLKPDIVLLTGDRFEIFAAAAAATITGIPIAHCHGGEITEGAIDDVMRHAVTKMSHLHFAAAEVYRNRIIQMGENPDNVFNVGALGIENINRLRLLTRREIEAELYFKLGGQSALVTFHPVTLEPGSEKEQFKNLVDALSDLQDLKIVFTKPNADAGNSTIAAMIDDFVFEHSSRAISVTSLGQLRYLSLLKNVDVVIGNSSSGIIEAPSIGTPTVNIGTRQKGRIMAKSIIQADTEKQAVKNAIQKALSADFKRQSKEVLNPYDKGNASDKVIQTLKNAPLDNVLKKSFFDLNTKSNVDSLSF
jgi:GDP/UDP-N,N'-diacetylbacillosamine 2-epimerase (hydrolysing)